MCGYSYRRGRKEKKMEEEEIGVSRATTDGLASASLKLLRKKSRVTVKVFLLPELFSESSLSFFEMPFSVHSSRTERELFIFLI